MHLTIRRLVAVPGSRCRQMRGSIDPMNSLLIQVIPAKSHPQFSYSKAIHAKQCPQPNTATEYRNRIPLKGQLLQFNPSQCESPAVLDQGVSVPVPIRTRESKVWQHKDWISIVDLQ